MLEVRRGEVYRISFEGARGHELRGPHYGVVVQDDLYNRLSTTLIVPLSSSAPMVHFHVPVTVNGQRTFALAEQLRAVDVDRRLKERIGELSSGAMAAIDEQLRGLLSLDLI